MHQQSNNHSLAVAMRYAPASADKAISTSGFLQFIGKPFLETFV
ncbi:hypothetical protein BHECKSOX2_620 [Bathymodiolus heckerae thiotrophic gill symbiont]|nr:hypothetical protein BHECKSOX2_620 [Bathymodiolus heckerae thiotrophic gill symbiont]